MFCNYTCIYFLLFRASTDLPVLLRHIEGNWLGAAIILHQYISLFITLHYIEASYYERKIYTFVIVILWYLNLQPPVQSVLITTKLWVRILFSATCTRWWLAVDRWFSVRTPVSYTNNSDLHDITEILLKVALNTINPNS